jgi:bifunctional non-homologous end joining protein LigD
VSAFQFIAPCSPVVAPAVPAEATWQHEVKFDGYRIQVHKVGKDVVIFSRSGHDFTSRFADLAYVLRDLPVRSAILDGELVASDRAGVPDFAELHRQTAAPAMLHMWAFDLLEYNGKDWRQQPLTKRQARLQVLLDRFDCWAILTSFAFDDGAALLRAAETHQLEGIVSKRRDSAYRSGDCPDWLKIKTSSWREENRERLFSENGR